jgi:hypothetical protein
VTAAQLTNKGRSVHALELDGVEGSLVLTSSLERVMRRVEVSGLLGRMRAGRLESRHGAAERLDLHGHGG